MDGIDQIQTCRYFTGYVFEHIWLLEYPAGHHDVPMPVNAK